MNIQIEVNSSEWESIMQRAPMVVQQALRDGVEDGVLYLERQMVAYPPQRHGSSYHRTGTLGRSWHHIINGQGNVIVGEVVSSGNIAPYNVYVQDATQQAAVHRGRWQTIQMVMERSQQTIFQMVEARLRAAFSMLR